MENILCEDAVFNYINNNIQRSIKPGPDGLKPIISPCINSTFLWFFYWDTYFADFALLETGNESQVVNNLDNMKWFVDNLGFVPNAYQSKEAEDNEVNRSQPPLFARGVWDYYSWKKDLNILRTYLPAIEKEYEFWQKNRMTPCGLNRYYHHADNDYLLSFYNVIMERLGLHPDLYEDKLEQGANFLAIAESGWDFNCRYPEGGNPYTCTHYVPVDLNSILYNVECIIARSNELLNNPEKAMQYHKYSEERKEKMNRYLLAPDGIYRDYNFITGEHSPYVSGASFCPFAMGVSDDVEALERVVSILEETYGISACEKKDRERFDQWDFPYMWPPVVYFCVTALKRLNSEKLEIVAKKYLSTVQNVYQQTGDLWEKYDSVKGCVGLNAEYHTPAMMGWTAGVYIYILRVLGLI